jgi:hypothetical protein
MASMVGHVALAPPHMASQQHALDSQLLSAHALPPQHHQGAGKGDLALARPRSVHSASVLASPAPGLDART